MPIKVKVAWAVLLMGLCGCGTVNLELAYEPETPPRPLHADRLPRIFLDRVEDAEGQLLLSKRKADFLKIWERIGQIYASGEIASGKIMRRILKAKELGEPIGDTSTLEEY